jgi:hypothetical protein
VLHLLSNSQDIEVSIMAFLVIYLGARRTAVTAPNTYEPHSVTAQTCSSVSFIEQLQIHSSAHSRLLVGSPMSIMSMTSCDAKKDIPRSVVQAA